MIAFRLLLLYLTLEKLCLQVCPYATRWWNKWVNQNWENFVTFRSVTPFESAKFPENIQGLTLVHRSCVSRLLSSDFIWLWPLWPHFHLYARGQEQSFTTLGRKAFGVVQIGKLKLWAVLSQNRSPTARRFTQKALVFVKWLY